MGLLRRFVEAKEREARAQERLADDNYASWLVYKKILVDYQYEKQAEVSEARQLKDYHMLIALRAAGHQFTEKEQRVYDQLERYYVDKANREAKQVLADSVKSPQKGYPNRRGMAFSYLHHLVPRGFVEKFSVKDAASLYVAGCDPADPEGSVTVNKRLRDDPEVVKAYQDLADQKVGVYREVFERLGFIQSEFEQRGKGWRFHYSGNPAKVERFYWIFPQPFDGYFADKVIYKIYMGLDGPAEVVYEGMLCNENHLKQVFKEKWGIEL